MWNSSRIIKRRWQLLNAPSAEALRNNLSMEDAMKLWSVSVKRRVMPLVAAIFLFSGAIVVDGCSNNDKQDVKNAREASSLQKKEKKILYWRAPMDPTYTSDKPGKSPMGMDLIPVYEGEGGTADTAGRTAGDSGKKEGKKILYWRAPMDPTYISDKPGKSPMGMDLVPVYEGEEQTGGPTVVIDPVTIQNMGVQTTPVQKVNLHRVIRTVGYLDYNEERLSRVNIKFSGWVEKLHVDETGQRVRKGQPMLSIYSPDLVATEEEYLLAYRNARQLTTSSFGDITSGGKSLLESSRRRLLYWDISEKQIRDLEEKGHVSKTVTLYAPSDGVVIKKMVEEGMRVMPGMDLYHLADLSKLWLYGQIYQYEVPFVKVGQPVEVQVSYIPGKTYKGRVDFVYPFLDEKTRDVNVRIVVPNPNLELKPQMYATVQFQSSIGPNVTAIPSDAVIRTGTRNIVFVAKGGGKFEPRDVVLGPEGQNSLVQVLAGLVPKENIVTSAQFMIDSESRLKAAIQKMLEAKKEGNMQASPESSQSVSPDEKMDDDGSMDSGRKNAERHDMKSMPKTNDREGHQMDHDSHIQGTEDRGANTGTKMDQMPTGKVIDPVCGMSIVPNEERSYSYKGTQYYFCSAEDMETFKSNPDEYVQHHAQE
jgi:multidrug efflux pump subunit AcrA (membrane-fusion protein)/YHS domain-containing protein